MHMGTMAKAVYWQQEALNSDGILNWNIGFVPYFNGTPYDVWETHAIYPKNGPANLNGEAIFLYESASLGFDPANPIVSLRLKHMSNGMEDYDYLVNFVEKKYGKGNTMGCELTGNCREGVLPNSKIKLSYATTVDSGFYEKDFSNGLGVVPDVIVPLPMARKFTDNIDEWVLWVAEDLVCREKYSG